MTMSTNGKTHKLLASAPTFDRLTALIAKFYGGEQKQVRETGPDSWAILRGNGTPIEGVRIVRQKGRYRFESFDQERPTHAETLRRHLEHAPRDPGPMAEGLTGWTIDDSGERVCALCAARIMARGCHLGGSATPVWTDSPIPAAACVCCGSAPALKQPEAAPAFTLQQQTKREGAHRAPKIKERQRLLLSGLDCDPRQADLFDA